MMNRHSNTQFALNIQYVVAGPMADDTRAKYLVVRKTKIVVIIMDMDMPKPLDRSSKSSALITQMREPIPGRRREILVYNHDIYIVYLYIIILR